MTDGDEIKKLLLQILETQKTIYRTQVTAIVAFIVVAIVVGWGLKIWFF